MSTSRPSVLRFAACVAALLYLSACASPGSTSYADFSEKTVAGTTVLISNSSTEGADAKLTGEIAISDGCLVLAIEGDSTPVVWPKGTTLSKTSVTVPDRDEEYRVGDTVSLSGGEAHFDGTSTCVPDGIAFIVWNITKV
ncbi:hypothetical protein V5R04_07340 [Jonesiaceae bacterium BS-20]|uniref:Uncharacterized protein n=1 Tax=Jonesiaceae bacterium BS-20 TaxID=3120821 RepID=A0AAU7DXY2_9MICO